MAAEAEAEAAAEAEAEAAAAAEAESLAAVILTGDYEMDGLESGSSSSWKRFLTPYTGSKDEDSAEFIQNLARAVEELRRVHEAKVGAQLKSFMGQSLSQEKRE